MENKVTLEYIISCIEKSGNDPRSQIYGYVTTGNECYITREGNARERIKNVEIATLEKYIQRAGNKGFM